MLVWMSSPQYCICSSWWCVDWEDDEEVTSGNRSSSIIGRCDALTVILIAPFILTLSSVDPDTAGNRVGANSTLLFWLHWPGDDESILPIVTTIVDTTTMSIVTSAIAGLPDPSQKICELWGCREEPNGDGGPYAHNVTPIVDNNTAAGWVTVAIKLSNPTVFCVIHHGQ